MCGIVGQLRPPGQPVDPDLVSRMCAGLEHRGPDSRGMHVAEHVGLGIQRLRVIDISTGDQPIYNEDHSVVVVLNGEIYNYRELRSELQARGHRFATQGDTEVIVHLYEEHGEACVEHLHGMFAFALHDRRANRLLIGRDRVGKKPLLYRYADGVLSFASEMHALLQDRDIPRAVDHRAIDAFLEHGYVPTPLTALQGVRKLPPAHTLVIEDGAATLRRYWQLDYGVKLDADVPELCERIRDGLRSATRKRMISDVPLGAFLSGGIDSSAVVAAMAEASSEPVRTFSIGFDHERFDELPHARAVAQQFGTVHEEFEVRADAVEVVPQMIRHYGEPFADPSAIPSFYLSELTRRHVTVALNGDGGDESFGGYQRYVANAMASRLDRIPAPLRRTIAGIGGRLPAGGAVTSTTNKVRRLAGTLALDGPGRYARYVAWFDGAARAALYTPGFAALVGDGAPDPVRAAWEDASGADVVDRMLEVDVRTYLVDDLIAKIDIATMAHALEARSPFLDHELMQLAASIPAGLKVRGGEKKWILREALRGWLPDELLDRPKQGFSVPLSAWLRGDLRSWAAEILLDPVTLGRGYFEPAAIRSLLDRHAAGADGEDKRIWALLMLELWHRDFIDAPLRDAVPAAA
ncbi:MAG TPA: asparagine synthase (glutamine-hydrolyzing) [Baekduia sp.]|jgi:asparagine synthase (glutamine-hydrolysing)